MRGSAVKLSKTIEVALPLLMRERVIDAVIEAQTQHGEPVTAQEVRASQPQPLMRHTRALTEVAQDIAAIGPDERGRRLLCAGKDRNGLLLWWVTAPKKPAKKRAAKKATRRPAKKARKRAG
jgi:hypothetical protein